MNVQKIFFISLLLVSNCHAMDTEKGPLASAPISASHTTTIDTEELARLQLEAARYQASLVVESERQDGIRHRGLSVAPVEPGHFRHSRQRSLSDPELTHGIPEASAVPVPPSFTEFDTRVKDGSLDLGLETLDSMERHIAELFKRTRQALKERAAAHQQLCASKLTPELPRATGTDRLRSKGSRTKRHLDKQVKENAKQKAESGRAFNHLLAAVIGANDSLRKLDTTVSQGAEKAAVKHEQLLRKASLTGTRRRTSSEPSLAAARAGIVSPPYDNGEFEC